MKFRSIDNKYLIVRANVQLTPHIDPVIYALDEEFRKANLKAYVTSGLRDSQTQLRIIRNEIVKRHLDALYQDVFEDINTTSLYNGEVVFSWQPAWSKLLNLGFIVNPPYAAKVLMDYYRPGSDRNRKGEIIHETPHARGTAFDVGGGSDKVDNEAKVIGGAIGRIVGLRGCLVERNNNAVHCDCDRVA